MKKIAVIVARFDGEPPRRLPEQKIPEGCTVDFFYFDDTKIKFNKELPAQKKEDFIKFNPHKIDGFKDHDVFVWLDKSVKVLCNDFVVQIVEQLGCFNFVVTMDKNIYAVFNNASVIQEGLGIYNKAQVRPVGVVVDEILKYRLITFPEGYTYYKIIPSPRPIIGFWHICLINNWKEVVGEQYRELVKYGLLDACERIHVGVVGPTEEFNKLDFSKIPKIQIDYHSEDITEYEFPTLKLIKEQCKVNEFYGFYLHTKGVTYNGHNGGNHWRHYMNYYNLEKWRDCQERLKSGSNVVGVKLLPYTKKVPNPTHFSGNYFHFRSEYADTCPEVDTLNTKNRFEAEFWICKGVDCKPVSMCDTFIDYDVKGDFIKPVIGRTVVHTLCFNLPSEVKTATDLLYKQNAPGTFEHVIVDIGFPLAKGNEIPPDIEIVKKENSRELHRYAKQMGSQYRKTENVGVSQNWETVRKNMKIGDHDVLICADPDERPHNAGWVKAISEVLMYGDKIGWCSLMYDDHIAVLKDYPHEVKYVFGHKIYLMKCLLGWAQGGFHGAFLNETGGVAFLPNAPRYGWLEDANYRNMQKTGWRWAIIADYGVAHTDSVPLYRAWKTHITSRVDQEGQMSFETWLNKQKQIAK